ncbi:MAG: TGS domain-containing protein [Chloroflexota bacterium]
MTDEEPLAIEPGATVADVADAVHHELGVATVGARVWGPSARFDGQRVGRETSLPTVMSWRSSGEGCAGSGSRRRTPTSRSDGE